jgi:hypothetical protein
MSNSENIITDIQQTIRLEFKKLGQAKSKTELLSESNLLYRSVCNDADNLFEPLNEWVDSIDLQNLSSYFREYMFAYIQGRPRQMAFYTVQVVEYFLLLWYVDFGGFEKIKNEALFMGDIKGKLSQNLGDTKPRNKSIIERIQENPHLQALDYLSDKSMALSLLTPFNKHVKTPIQEKSKKESGKVAYLDGDFFTVLRHLRNKHSHAAKGEFKFNLFKYANETDEDYSKRLLMLSQWLELEEQEYQSNVKFVKFHKGNMDLLLAYRFYIAEHLKNVNNVIE